MKLKFTCFIFLSLFTNILMAQTSNTWVSGSSSVNQSGSYGTKGMGLPIFRGRDMVASAGQKTTPYGYSEDLEKMEAEIQVT